MHASNGAVGLKCTELIASEVVKDSERVLAVHRRECGGSLKLPWQLTPCNLDVGPSALIDSAARILLVE